MDEVKLLRPTVGKELAPDLLIRRSGACSPEARDRTVDFLRHARRSSSSPSSLGESMAVEINGGSVVNTIIQWPTGIALLATTFSKHSSGGMARLVFSTYFW